MKPTEGVTILSLTRRGSPLAGAREQVRILESTPGRFHEIVASHGRTQLTARSLDVLQVNVGKVCNQTCRHCHVDAGPDRRESMSLEIARECLRVLKVANISTLDITGGAPEMNPQFRQLVSEASELGRRVIDRCNLTILQAPGFEDLTQFLATHRVEIVASLPCYLEENVDRQRGADVFHRSIKALQKLNEVGYGIPGSELRLSLVFNPQGPALPPPQAELETAYRRELQSRYGIQFHNLYAMTNLPVSRFLDELIQTEQFDEYMNRLCVAFNPATLDGVMCRSMISVDWNGNLFDCDFNQMLELGIRPEYPRHIRDVNEQNWRSLVGRPIVTSQHCLGCTAGAGSSCQGSVTP